MTKSVVYNISNVPESGKFFHLGHNSVDFSSLRPVNMQNNKIIFIGDAYCGKTTLIGFMRTNKFQEDYYATIGCAFVQIDCTINAQDVKLHIWDTSGEEKTNSMTKQYYRGSNFACICFAFDDPASFRNVERWYAEIKDNSGENLFGIFLIGCKNDLEKKVSNNEIEIVCKKYKMEFFETSAKESYNIDNLVKRLCYIATVMQLQQSKAKKIAVSSSVDISPEKSTKPIKSEKEKCDC